MPAEYQCPTCGEIFRDWTTEAVLKRASDHAVSRHDGRHGPPDDRDAAAGDPIRKEAA